MKQYLDLRSSPHQMTKKLASKASISSATIPKISIWGRTRDREGEWEAWVKAEVSEGDCAPELALVATAFYYLEGNVRMMVMSDWALEAVFRDFFGRR